jgi:hypothetical protein
MFGCVSGRLAHYREFREHVTHAEMLQHIKLSSTMSEELSYCFCPVLSLIFQVLTEVDKGQSEGHKDNDRH